jgi:hypothetical protein
MIVGAYAVSYYAQPRYTKDMDIYINPTEENARRIWKALERFGAPLQNITLRDFQDKELVYQIGMEPNRVENEIIT